MNKKQSFLKNKYFRYGVATVSFALWVVWLGNYWFMLGLPIIFDMYITKKVKWAFWKAKPETTGFKRTVLEWVDALIFAVIAVTFVNTFFFQNYNIPTPSMEKSLLVGDYLFVSKVNYGPKVPETPVAMPFVHHTLPFTHAAPSFTNSVKWDYKRLAGTGKVNRGDIVVFNFPEGDTVSSKMQASSYYALLRQYGREAVHTNKAAFGNILNRPVDKMDNYVKRCVGVAGDVLEVKSGQLFIDDKSQDYIENIQFNYTIVTDGSQLNPKRLAKMGVNNETLKKAQIAPGTYVMPLTPKVADAIEQFPVVEMVQKQVNDKPDFVNYIFPHHPLYKWTEDNFGPLTIPAKGVTVALNSVTLPLYKRLITVYEHNELKVKGNEIFVNGKTVTQYTFTLDYYFMMGDNRHNSADSRFWGFVPETHVVGKPLFVYLSLDQDKTFPFNIRWSRMLRGAHSL